MPHSHAPSHVTVSMHVASPPFAPLPLTARPHGRSGDLDVLQSRLDALRPVLRIAVIYGGNKDEQGAVIHPTYNTRPWKSYRAVAEDIVQSLRRCGFCHVSLMPDDLSLGGNLRRERIDFAWLNTGGVQGQAPMAHAPALLELCGIPYVGHDPLTVGTLDNKHAFKRDLICLGLPTAPFMTWHMARGPFRPKINSRFIQAFKDHWGPFIVKPVSGRASLHVHVVESEADLPDAVATVYDITQNHVLIEAYLPGHEYCVAVAGPITVKDGELLRRVEPFVFSPIERVLRPTEQIFTSMDIEPITTDRLQVLDIKSNLAIVSQLNELGRQVYLDFNLESLIRLDLRQDTMGRLCILEANPKPDLKAPKDGTTSLIAAGLSSFGMSYDDLILSMFADRLNLLFAQRPQAISHIATLVA